MNRPIAMAQQNDYETPLVTGTPFRVQHEANRTYSVYEGLAFRKGGFCGRFDAEQWAVDFARQMSA